MLGSQRRNLGTWGLGAALTLVVAAIGVLAYEAVGLDRSHRAVAEGVLRDYSAFAADQFARLASARLTTLTQTILEPVACGSSPAIRRASAIERTVASGGGGSTCANPTGIDAFFEIDAADGKIIFMAGAVDDRTRGAIVRVAARNGSSVDLLTGDAPLRFLGYWRENIPGRPQHVVGFIAPAAMLQPVFDDIVDTERLLPGALTTPAHNRADLAVDVRDAEGRSVYRTGATDARFVTTRAIGSATANMRVHLAISSAAADRLIIGGVPKSRLPLLTTLLTVALGLLIVGGWQVQREWKVARMRVDFVRSASHELRTPLAQIRMFTETLQLGRVRSWSEVLESLAFVDQQSRRLTRLVDNLLAFAHGSQRRHPNLEAIELQAFVSEITRGFQPILETLGQRACVEAGTPVTVRADREWLTQVVLNLLDNSAKYGPKGQTIAVTVETRSGEAHLAVLDQGPGIPATDRQRIFAPFVRLAREHERRTGGTGIGLAVAADLMAAMNGRIWADATPAGARLVVALPALPQSEAQTLVA